MKPTQITFALLAFALATTASADEWDDCAQTADPSRKLAGCTALIESGRLPANDMAMAFSNRGIAHYDLNRFSDAVSDYDRAIELDPDHPYPHNNRANALLLLGEVQTALRGYDRAIELDPDYVVALRQRANVLLVLLRPREAARDAGRLIALEPNNIWGYIHRGRALQMSKLYAEAIADFDAALTIQPDLPEVLMMRGGCHYMLRAHQKALDDVDRAFTMIDPTAGMHFPRAHVLVALGRNDEARAEFERFLAIAKPQEISAFQQYLAQGGYYAGPIDGVAGPGTRVGLEKCILDGCRLEQ